MTKNLHGLSTAGGAEKVVNAALQKFGAIDILVNNVGAAKGAGIVDTPDAVWQEAFDQTLYPAIRMSRLVVPHMKKQGSGSIVMIASIWGRESGGRMTYNAVKAAEISLAKSLAQQLAPRNIRVNAFNPGYLEHSMSRSETYDSDPKVEEAILRMTPMARRGKVDEVVGVAIFLASDASSFITGTVLPVDGGWCAM